MCIVTNCSHSILFTLSVCLPVGYLSLCCFLLQLQGATTVDCMFSSGQLILLVFPCGPVAAVLAGWECPMVYEFLCPILNDKNKRNFDLSVNSILWNTLQDNTRYEL